MELLYFGSGILIGIICFIGGYLFRDKAERSIEQKKSIFSFHKPNILPVSEVERMEMWEMEKKKKED